MSKVHILSRVCVQPLRLDDETVILEILDHGQVNMLYNPKLIVQKYGWGLSPQSKFSDDENEDKSLVANGVELRNFGAAYTYIFNIFFILIRYSFM